MADHITPVEKRLNCHAGSHAKVRCNTFLRIGRLLSLFRTRFMPLAEALLIALTVMRNEVTLELIFRNDSDPGLSENENLADLGGQQQLQQPSKQQELQEQPQPMNWTAFNIALHGTQGCRWDFRLLLQEKGLLEVGDSTARYLFGTLWCFMDGIFPSDGHTDWKVCNQRQNKIKEKYQTLMDSGEHCELTIPTFANETTNLRLRFQRNWRIGNLLIILSTSWRTIAIDSFSIWCHVCTSYGLLGVERRTYPSIQIGILRLMTYSRLS